MIISYSSSIRKSIFISWLCLTVLVYVTLAQTNSPTFDSTVPPSDSQTLIQTSTLNPTLPELETTQPSPAPVLTPAPVVITTKPSDTTTPVPTLSPTATASDLITSAPVIPPTVQPSDLTTAAPTIPPSVGATEEPTSKPTLKPTVGKTAKPTRKPTSEPTSVPTGKPTSSGTKVTSTVEGVTVEFGGVGELSTEDITAYERTTAAWFNTFFNQRLSDERFLSSLRRRLVSATTFKYDDNRTERFLQQSDNIRRMNSTIFLTGQAISSVSNRLVYSHTLSYISVDGNEQDPSALVLEPYQDEVANTELASLLMRAIQPTFDGIESPIAVPEIVTPTEEDTDDGGLPLAAIIGIAVGGGVVCCIALFVGARAMGRDKDGTGYVDTGSLPPSQFNINAAEDISTMEDPTITKVASGDMSVGQYGDQSVATVDYDYSKAYGGGADSSVVSSVGGTLGDNTRQTSGDIVANSARAALGASFEADVQNEFREEIIVINAPAGKLGVVIDTPDDGAPVVHAVKDSSVIADKIRVGDKLIAVDDDDVRSMTAIKVSKLISKKSANPSRKLTIVRMTHVDHP